MSYLLFNIKVISSIINDLYRIVAEWSPIDRRATRPGGLRDHHKQAGRKLIYTDL